MRYKTINILDINFCDIKAQADKIQDLNERELYLCECLTCYKQAKNEGNFEQQITDEICLTQRKKELSGSKKNTNKNEQIVEETDLDNDGASVKVKIAIMLGFLNTMNCGIANNNDRTQICRFIARVIGSGYQRVLKEMKKGIELTNFHGKEIKEFNEILSAIKAPISIQKGRQY